AFPRPLEGEDRRVTVALLSDLLRSSYRPARLAALDLVASSRGKLAQEISLAESEGPGRPGGGGVELRGVARRDDLPVAHSRQRDAFRPPPDPAERRAESFIGSSP